ncbi:lytic murein transglycosylase [Streptomyces paromomycinus]|uniref:Lytic transglycosylase n=1 Tax=Streptomyces paromomycinus TaxID=92743 RepID=A0A401VWF1_STREY|nr:lytic murein transglycosylase [Streptomyces paromomycinus]GCD41389.1 lytic transglycosylase [Streptomyces paromomycinus]
MNPFPTLPTLVARRVRQSLCACALAASLSAAATLSPLEAAGPSRADARQAAAGPDSPQSRHRGDPALDLPNLLRDGQGKEPDAVAAGQASPGTAGIPATALAAYRKAEGVLRGSQPSCRLPWELVAGIGRVESVHASGYGLRGDGSTARPIRGPRLDGVQFALIRDTDGGRWDGDAVFDRAVGPMQFIPSTWGSWGADGNGDGVKDPNNIFDAALGTARYLCAGDRDLSRDADLDRAVLSYNNSRAYVNAVRKWMDTYRGSGVTETPDDAPATPHRPDPADRALDAGRVHPTPLLRPEPEPEPAPGRRGKGGAGSGGGVRHPAVPTPQRPADKPAPEPVEKPKPVADHHTVVRLESLGDRHLEAEAGTAFGRQPQVRALDAHGHPVPGARVTFRGNGVRLTGEADAVTVTADRGGVATAPALQPGDHPGRFTLTATASGGRGPAVDFTVSVRPVLYRLELWDRDHHDHQDPQRPPLSLPLEAGSDSLLSELPSVRVTRNGRPAAGLRIAVTVLTAVKGEKPAPALDGPSFLDEYERDRPVRSLLLPPTAADGRITLPPLHTGPRPGSYLLRLAVPSESGSAAPSGNVLDIPLTVTSSPSTGPRIP